MDFLGESEGSLPPPHDSFPDAGEAINDFWSMSGNFIFRRHVELRVKLYVPWKNHPLFQLNTLTYPELLIRIWMSSKRSALMIIGTLMALETCLILGQLSHNFALLEEQPPDGYLFNEKTAYIQARSFMARNLENNGKKCKAQGEAKVVT